MKRFIFLLAIFALLLWAHFAHTQKMTVTDTDSNVLMEVSDEGTTGALLLPAGGTPSETGNRLYNTGDVLYWNGTALIPQQAGQLDKVLSTNGTNTQWRTHNVPLANHAGGNMMCRITQNYAWYQNIKSVTLTTPGSGVVIVSASGYLRWESKGWDLILASILRNSDPNASWDAENEFFRYLSLSTDYNCTDSSDQYTSFACHRGFNVGAGTQTFVLWANKYTSSAKVRIDDVNMSAIYFPTGGTIISPEASPDGSEGDRLLQGFESRVTHPPLRDRH